MSFDADAESYMTAVETADAVALPGYKKTAINDLVVALKAAGFWSKMQAMCLLAGPATLDGSLVPLRGPSPTRVGLVAGDHNELGIIGGETKYIKTGFFGDSFEDINLHGSVYLTELFGNVSFGIGTFNVPATGRTAAAAICSIGGASNCRWQAGNVNLTSQNITGLFGISRVNSAGINVFIDGSLETTNISSGNPVANFEYGVFARSTSSGFSINSDPSRIGIYTIGTGLSELDDLALICDDYMAAISVESGITNTRRRRSRSCGGVL